MSRLAIFSVCVLLAVVCCNAQQALPRIDLHYDVLDSESFSPATLSLRDGEFSQNFQAQIRHRGDLSLSFDKPSYAVKIIDADGAKQDTSLLGMRSDNYWILDAMAVDDVRMRNRVSMDLWLEYSRDPWYKSLEPKMINGFRGQMVEVYVDNVPSGVYCLSERVDRKQLKLKKFSSKKGVRGVMYRAISATSVTQFVMPSDSMPSDGASRWCGWEVKYPDIEDGESISWQRLVDLLSFVNTASSEEFADNVADYVDIPVFIDYVLLCELTYATDNLRKNTTVSYYDADTRLALFTPWDLDLTWGRNYSGMESGYDNRLLTRNALYRRCVKECGWFVTAMESRWAELRESHFTPEHITSLFDRYFNLYSESGIDVSETQLWTGHNNIMVRFDVTRVTISNWVKSRIAFLDKCFNYVSDEPTALPCSRLRMAPSAKLSVDDGHVVIHSAHAVYDVMGRKIR